MVRSVGETEVRPRAGVWLAALAGLLAVVFTVYQPALHGGFLWDDDDYVAENPLLHDADGLRRIWTTGDTPQYYPLVFTTFWVEHHLWGQDTTGYHAVNIALHAINALLAGLVLRSLRVPGAFWVALLFAVHPVHVESVAWITERKNVLSALFYLSSFLAYLKFDRDGRRRDYAIALALFLAALLGKTVTATLPVVLVLALLHLRRRVTARDLARLAPFVVLAVGMGLVTVAMERGMVDIVRDDFAFTVGDRLRIATRAPLFYAAKLIVPRPLIFNYPRWDLAAGGLAAWWPPAACLALAAGLTALWRRGHRGPALAVLYFVITLFPALGLFDVYPFRYSFVADHFQYLASLGVLVLVVQAGRFLASRAPRLLPRIDAAVARARAGVALGTFAAAVLAMLAWQQAGAYRDLRTLWTDTLRKNPGSWLAHNNLGLMLLRQGDVDAAFAHLERAVRLRPHSAESRTALAMALARSGRNRDALDELDRAVENDPTYPQAYMQRAEVCRDLGDLRCVVDDLGRVLAANPHYLEGYRLRAEAWMRLGRPEDAITDLDEAIRHGAGAQAWNDRGVARLQTGRFDLALDDLDHALAAGGDPAPILHNRAVALLRLGRASDALASVDRALALDPDAVRSWVVRGQIHAEALGDPRAACDDWQRACRLGTCAPFEEHCPGDAGVTTRGSR